MRAARRLRTSRRPGRSSRPTARSRWWGAGGHRGAFLVAWRPDGALGFARFPGLGFGLSRVLTLTDVQALPTGGYVAVGSTVDLTGDTDRARTPTIFAAGLDAVGRIFWARDYALGAPGAWRPVAHPGLRLTDEGGALLAAVAADDGDGGAAWALHVRARDGGIDLDPARADAAPLAIQDLECAVESAPWAAEVTSTALAPSGLQVVATPITVSARRQTP
ncbi:MAG: hypothetical protein KC933_16265 [Myxococcales bacterium]|nr:hypothetical protein [Myxococcales bacterium]